MTGLNPKVAFGPLSPNYMDRTCTESPRVFTTIIERDGALATVEMVDYYGTMMLLQPEKPTIITSGVPSMDGWIHYKGGDVGVYIIDRADQPRFLRAESAFRGVFSRLVPWP